MATEVPKTIADPTPCRTRAVSSWAWLAARPQRSEEAVNIMKPRVKILFLPKMSAARPIGTSSAAEDRRKDKDTQPIAIASRPSSGAIAGRATFVDESMNGVEKDARTAIRSTVFGAAIQIFYNFR